METAKRVEQSHADESSMAPLHGLTEKIAAGVYPTPPWWRWANACTDSV